MSAALAAAMAIGASAAEPGSPSAPPPALVPVDAQLQAKLDAVLDAGGLGPSVVAYAVMDLGVSPPPGAPGVGTGAPASQPVRLLAAREPRLPMIPASNMKLFTSAGALAELGPKFAFETQLRFLQANDQPVGAIAGPTLVVRGDGDPAFADPRVLAATTVNGKPLDVDGLLGVWVAQVKAAGIAKVDKLLVDDRIFERRLIHPAWPVDQLDYWYCAPVSGLNFHTNCVDIYGQPANPGQPSKLSIQPYAPFVQILNQTETGPANSFSANRLPQAFAYVARGKVRSDRLATTTMHDPGLFLGMILADRLVKAGVAVGGVERAPDGAVLPMGKTLHVIRTPIAQALARCNKNSQNLYAESLLKRLGAKAAGAASPAGQPGGQPGSWDNGAAALQGFLRQRLGAMAGDVRISDGSGMSKENRVTAGAVCSLLASMRADPTLGPIYRESLSVGGRDGSLEEHFKTGLRGVVYGKTGFVEGVRSLSGYLVVPALASPAGVAPSERTLAFSLLFNQLPANVNRAKALQVRDQWVRAVDEHFQK